MSSKKDYAVQFVAREQAELHAVERDPTPLAPDEIAGSSIVTLISAGTETTGSYSADSGFPRGSGYAAVFQAEVVGAEVTDVQAGDYIFCMGNHRSYHRVKRDAAIPLPQGLAPETGVFARLMNVSLTTLTTTTARPPERVVVTGLGIIGNLAAQNFTHAGYEVFACEPIESRRKVAIECGLKNVLPAVPVADPDIVDTVALVVDCSGHEQAVLDGCNVVRKKGEVVLIATPWRRYTEMYAHTILRAIFHRYVVVRSGWEWELPHQATEFRTNSIYGNLNAGVRWLGEGRMCVAPLATKISPGDAQTAYQNLLHKRNERLTYLFDWTTL